MSAGEETVENQPQFTAIMQVCYKYSTRLQDLAKGLGVPLLSFRALGVCNMLRDNTVGEQNERRAWFKIYYQILILVPLNVFV